MYSRQTLSTAEKTLGVGAITGLAGMVGPWWITSTSFVSYGLGLGGYPGPSAYTSTSSTNGFEGLGVLMALGLGGILLGLMLRLGASWSSPLAWRDSAYRITALLTVLVLVGFVVNVVQRQVPSATAPPALGWGALVAFAGVAITVAGACHSVARGRSAPPPPRALPMTPAFFGMAMHQTPDPRMLGGYVVGWEQPAWPHPASHAATPGQQA